MMKKVIIEIKINNKFCELKDNNKLEIYINWNVNNIIYLNE